MTEMTQHPAACTICCKHAATTRSNETILDFAVDISYALLGVCYVAVHFLLVPLGVMLLIIPAILSKRPKLGRRAQERLQQLRLEKKDAFEIQQDLHHEISISLQDLAYNDQLLDETERLLRELPDGYDPRQLRRRLEDIDRVQQQHNDLINQNMALIEEMERLWKQAEKQRLEIEYAKGSYSEPQQFDTISSALWPRSLSE